MFWSKQRHVKGEKHIAPMDFAEYLRKSDVSENSEKVYYGRFLRNELHKGYCYISKSRWNVQYLKSLVFGRVMKMELNDQGFF